MKINEEAVYTLMTFQFTFLKPYRKIPCVKIPDVTDNKPSPIFFAKLVKNLLHPLKGRRNEASAGRERFAGAVGNI